jgi:hypothetical protein
VALYAIQYTTFISSHSAVRQKQQQAEHTIMPPHPPKRRNCSGLSKKSLHFFYVVSCYLCATSNQVWLSRAQKAKEWTMTIWF